MDRSTLKKKEEQPQKVEPESMLESMSDSQDDYPGHSGRVEEPKMHSRLTLI